MAKVQGKSLRVFKDYTLVSLKRVRLQPFSRNVENHDLIKRDLSVISGDIEGIKKRRAP